MLNTNIPTPNALNTNSNEVKAAQNAPQTANKIDFTFEEYDIVIPSQSKLDLRQTAEALTLAIELLANEEIYSLQIVPLVRILRNYIDAEPSASSK